MDGKRLPLPNDLDGSWEARVQALAGDFPYPPTPDLARAVDRRLAARRARRGRSVSRLAWAAIALVILFAGLLAVPQVRAAVQEVLRLGAVRILLPEPTTAPLATSQPSGRPGETAVPGAATPAATSAATAEPGPSPTAIPTTINLAGETTLEKARAQVSFPIRLPAYPADLGPPGRVFLQRVGNGPALILVWLDPDRPGDVRLSLHALGPGALVEKVRPQVIQETLVHGQRALWTEGPYMLQARNGNLTMLRLITGNTLIWMEGDVTYRLESKLSLDEAVKVAESLQP